MSLYQYFKKASLLPSPDGQLSHHMPSSAIKGANKKVEPLLEPSKSKELGKRGSYQIYTENEKLKIEKRAAEMGVTSTIKFFKDEFSDRPLKESTVRTWSNNYKRELALKRKFSDDMTIAKLSGERRGPPLHLGKELDAQVQSYVTALRENGGVINSAIVRARAIGIV